MTHRNTKKWVTKLDDLVESYNNTLHSSLFNGKKAPNDIPDNQ